ncbi:MAG: hypothetical protein LKF50_08690 [Solobacterium sp.]|jgi:DNA-directed RNA polymerase subunit RPC12/RpoP|nr:hypothetical protein [Solobacterium sp.]MCH4222615.1 hypothetical protein [Solobacterium sp.]
MPSQVTDYKCPNCGGPLHFDATAQQLTCDYCKSNFTVQEVEQFYQKKNEEAAATPNQFTQEEMGWTDEEASHLRAYSCPSCGAQIICDDTTAATSCPYCGNPTIVPGQLAGALKPQYIIPFKLKKEAAIEKLKGFYQGKTLLPNAFKEENHIEEIKGVYVPFWLYDGTIDADLAFEGTRTRVHTEGDDEVTETSHYRIVRKGQVSFEKVPADASQKMSDQYMDALEPFDWAKLEPFKMSYLPGYLADRYDISDKEDEARTDERMKNSTVAALSATVMGYDSAVPVRQYLRRIDGQASYALLPVWVLSTKYDGKQYLFTMNGQTGKMVGSLPMDRKKFWMYFFIIMAITLLVSVLIYFFGIAR